MSDKLLRKVLSVIEEFRQIDPEIPTQMVSTFLAIALQPGITTTEIEKQLKLTLSSASRNVRRLSNRPKAGETGHGLIEYRPDPKDYRRLELHPTREGYKILKAVLAAMKESE